MTNRGFMKASSNMRGWMMSVLVAAVLGAGAVASNASEAPWAINGPGRMWPRASLQVKLIATVGQTNDASWSLSKTGAYDASSSSVTWTIEAAQTGGSTNELSFSGTVRVRNLGAVSAPIGNVVVNLQRLIGDQWVTLSSNVADATSGDAATSAVVNLLGDGPGGTRIDEDDASGALTFTNDADAPWSLAPRRELAPRAAFIVNFVATFDNDALGLPNGARVRAELIVTHGNAGPHGHSAYDLDIDGDGAIDGGEARVDSALGRAAGLVPPAVPGGGTVELLDDESDLSTTGTVTYSNPVFDLGETTGTVTVSVDGGDDGGTITNCARLVGETFTRDACDTRTIPGRTFEWQNGDVITYDQGALGGDPSSAGSAAELLFINYQAVYAPTFGVVEFGIPGAAGFSVQLANEFAVLGFLPAFGAPQPLVTDHFNPTTTEAGAFGGEVLTLRINIDFSDVGLTRGTLGIPFGDLRLCDLVDTSEYNGLTVREFLEVANTALGGGGSPYPVATIAALTDELNTSFASGVVSVFARDHVVFGACP